MAHTEKLIGEHGENQAAAVLSGLGVEMIEKIGTPVQLTPYKSPSRPGPGNVFYVKFGEKVSGDRRGILPDGTSVLIEVKTMWDHNLQYSNMREHQPERLKIHDSFNGLSLLVWIHHSGIYVMQFPIDGFEPGKSITPERAAELDRETRKYITGITYVTKG